MFLLMFSVMDFWTLKQEKDQKIIEIVYSSLYAITSYMLLFLSSFLFFFFVLQNHSDWPTRSSCELDNSERERARTNNSTGICVD